jgi:hypothetical protein
MVEYLLNLRKKFVFEVLKTISYNGFCRILDTHICVDEDQSPGMLWNVDWSIDVDICEAPAASPFRVKQPKRESGGTLILRNVGSCLAQ